MQSEIEPGKTENASERMQTRETRKPEVIHFDAQFVKVPFSAAQLPVST